MLKLSASSLDWALNNAERLGDTGFFPLPFEFSAIKHGWDKLSPLLASIDVSNWEARPHRECLSPKTALSFRIATELDPLDWLVYSALVYEIGEDLESYRLPQKDGNVFSWRFEPQTDGTMFSRKVGYFQFQEVSREYATRADSQYVVVADIADFYPSLYHHRVENALQSAAQSKADHVKAIMRLLSAWRERQSFGIPVGPQPSRLIAEVAIHDVDQAMLGEGLKFVRYVDDFRIFCKSRKQAYTALATLADILWKSHGLTLAAHKTEILPAQTFAERYFRSARETELERLSESFAGIADELALETWYEPIDYVDLDDEQKARVDALNLEELLTEQLQSQKADIQLTKFILRRLSQLQVANPAEEILDHIDGIYPAFTDVIAYLGSLKNLTIRQRTDIGKKILGLLDDSVVSHLEYHRLHLLNLFASSSDWGNATGIAELLSRFSDHFTKRKSILALGQSGQSHWFRRHKTTWQQFSPWERRAFLRGASSLEDDERRFWYGSIWGRLDPLERAIVSWSKQYPISA